MQAEGIRKGDRYDVNSGGRITGGWTATGDAVVEDGWVYVPVRYHDGQEGTNSYQVGRQVPLTFGAGPATCPKTGRSATACDTPDHRNCPDLGALS
jgi:hypothetical protein